MNWDRIHGHRARIGYTVAAVTTEVYPIDWYRVVPEGVSLMMITLPLGDRSKEDLEKCYAISIESAHTMARAGADLVLLGGLPINISKGDDTVEDLMAGLEKDIGVKMSCSALAQVRAFAALESKKVIRSSTTKTRAMNAPSAISSASSRWGSMPGGLPWCHWGRWRPKTRSTGAGRPWRPIPRPTPSISAVPTGR